MTFKQVPPSTKCKRCGHVFEVHAPDVSYPNKQRCFHKAATGEGCTEQAGKYDDRCPDFVYPEGL